MTFTQGLFRMLAPICDLWLAQNCQMLNVRRKEATNSTTNLNQ